MKFNLKKSISNISLVACLVKASEISIFIFGICWLISVNLAWKIVAAGSLLLALIWELFTNKEDESADSNPIKYPVSKFDKKKGR